MTFTETRPPTQTSPPANTWVNTTWEEFVAIADDPASAKKTCYYFNHQMRIETMGVGPDHAVDNGILHTAIVLYCTLKAIVLHGLIKVMALSLYSNPR